MTGYVARLAYLYMSFVPWHCSSQTCMGYACVNCTWMPRVERTSRLDKFELLRLGSHKYGPLHTAAYSCMSSPRGTGLLTNLLWLLLIMVGLPVCYMPTYGNYLLYDNIWKQRIAVYPFCSDIGRHCLIKVFQFLHWRTMLLLSLLDMGSHALVSRFLKGRPYLRPSHTIRVLSWDLLVVLDTLYGAL